MLFDVVVGLRQVELRGVGLGILGGGGLRLWATRRAGGAALFGLRVESSAAARLAMGGKAILCILFCIENH